MKFLIVNTDNNTVLEEHSDKHVADRICGRINNYIKSNGGVPTYFVQPTCPMCHSDEMEYAEMDSEDKWLCMSCHNILSLKGKHK